MSKDSIPSLFLESSTAVHRNVMKTKLNINITSQSLILSKSFCPYFNKEIETNYYKDNLRKFVPEYFIQYSVFKRKWNEKTLPYDFKTALVRMCVFQVAELCKVDLLVFGSTCWRPACIAFIFT